MAVLYTFHWSKGDYLDLTSKEADAAARLCVRLNPKK
jgi:hypothetical protein